MDISPEDHIRLKRIVARQMQKAAKDREFCREIGDEWSAFLEDKKRGDPRIKIAAQLYDLQIDTLTRYARVAQQSRDDWKKIDQWAATTRFESSYEHEPQKSLDYLRAYRADQSATEAIRLAPTDSSNPGIEVLCGDALSVLKTLPDRQFHTCITSPPYYQMRDFGAGAIGMEPTLDDYITTLVTVLQELRRVLRDDGVCWCVIGDRYAADTRTEEIRKDRFLRNPMPARAADAIPAGNLMLTPQHLAIALQRDGWIVRAVVVWDKVRVAQGVGVLKRPLSTHETLLMLCKRSRYYYIEPTTPTDGPRRAGPFQRRQGQRAILSGRGKKHSGDVIRITAERREGGHTATFPTELVRWCADRTLPPHGAMIDPFAGSGTVGIVAAERRVSATLIEINPKFVALAKRRIALARVAPLVETDQAEAAD